MFEFPNSQSSKKQAYSTPYVTMNNDRISVILGSSAVLQHSAEFSPIFRRGGSHPRPVFHEGLA